jgi:hypothetical protein
LQLIIVTSTVKRDPDLRINATPIFMHRPLNQLKVTGICVGLLVNITRKKAEIKRLVLDLPKGQWEYPATPIP